MIFKKKSLSLLFSHISIAAWIFTLIYIIYGINSICTICRAHLWIIECCINLISAINSRSSSGLHSKSSSHSTCSSVVSIIWNTCDNEWLRLSIWRFSHHIISFPSCWWRNSITINIFWEINLSSITKIITDSIQSTSSYGSIIIGSLSSATHSLYISIDSSYSDHQINSEHDNKECKDNNHRKLCQFDIFYLFTLFHNSFSKWSLCIHLFREKISHHKSTFRIFPFLSNIIFHS